MAILWSDPTEGQGVLPAQAPFPGPSAISPQLINSILQQQQAHSIGNITQQAIQGFANIMQQRSNDRIANTLLAAQASGHPATVEQLHGAATPGLFGGPDVQDLGGARALGAYQNQVQDFQRQQTAAIHNQLMSSEIAKNLGYGRPGAAPSDKVWSNELGGYVTPYQQFQATQKLGKATLDPGVEKARKEMDAFGFTPQDLVNPPEFHPVDVPGKRKGETDRAYRITLDDGRTALVPEEKVNRWSNLMVAGKFNAQPAAAPQASGDGATTNTAALSQANQIKTDFKSGKLTADEARTKLSALGIFSQ